MLMNDLFHEFNLELDNSSKPKANKIIAKQVKY